MPALIKRPGSPYFFAAFDVRMPDGSIRRLKKTTKQTKRNAALKEALKLEEAFTKEHRAEGENASKAYAILTDATESAARGELSEGRARELLARLTEVSTGSPLKFYTLRTWAGEWLEMKEATIKPATMARYKASIAAFLAWMGDRADSRLEAVTKPDMRKFRDAIRDGWKRERPRKPEVRKRASKVPRKPVRRTAATANDFTADVAGMFRSAVREGLLLASPCAAMDRLPEDDSITREPFTVAEVGMLVSAAAESNWQDSIFPPARNDAMTRNTRCSDWAGAILVGFYTGARLCDCCGLIWGNLNLSKKLLTFMPAKTSRKKKRLEVPLHPRLLSWLKDRKIGGDTEPLFPALHGLKSGGQQGLSSQFVAIMQSAGVDRLIARQGEEGGCRAQHTRSFHSLRHSLTSGLANLDVPEEIRRRIVGHDSAEAHAGYTHHEQETLARAVEKMPSV